MASISGEEQLGWRRLLNIIRNMPLHFQDLEQSEGDMLTALSDCDLANFELHGHFMQDYFSHYWVGYRAWPFFGHALAGNAPDDSTTPLGEILYEAASDQTEKWVAKWDACCCGANRDWSIMPGASDLEECTTVPEAPDLSEAEAYVERGGRCERRCRRYGRHRFYSRVRECFNSCMGGG